MIGALEISSFDGSCLDCTIESNLVNGKGDGCLAVGIVVVGGSRNRVVNNNILNCQTGICLGEDQGMPISEPCNDNVFSLNVISGCSTGISAASGHRNLICNNKVIGDYNHHLARAESTLQQWHSD